jgi:hypothetical protein
MRHLLVTATIILAGVACTRPSPDAPGVGEQPELHPERSPATQPTRPDSADGAPPSESADNPDQLGTTRTPPAAPAAPMDEVDDAGIPGPDAGRARR